MRAEKINCLAAREDTRQGNAGDPRTCGDRMMETRGGMAFGKANDLRQAGVLVSFQRVMMMRDRVDEGGRESPGLGHPFSNLAMVDSKNLTLEIYVIAPINTTQDAAEFSPQTPLFPSRHEQRQIANVMQQPSHAGRASKGISGRFRNMLREDGHLHAMLPNRLGIIVTRRGRTHFGNPAKQNHCVK